MIEIGADTTYATISPQGAEIVAWRVGDIPLLWEPKPEVWPEIAPLLFPVVGWTRNHQARVGKDVFPLELHGFVRQREFSLVRRSADSVTFGLASDAQTRALYPFDFEFLVSYRVGNGAVATEIEVRNTGDAPMPYACGLHPGFRWPFAGGAATDYRLRFAAPENPTVPRIAAGGLIARQKRTLPLEGKVLPLAPALFDNDALCFLNAASRQVRFEAPNGAAIVIEVEDFPHFGVWCRPGNGYLCIEEWTGFSDPEDFSGDLFDKPSMRVLTPGAAARHAASFRYAAAPEGGDALAAAPKPDR